jgi:anti-anti-sigma factor
MESTINLELTEKILKITLTGKLDAVKAPELMEELKNISGNAIEKIIFYVKDLEYISSAGLRTIIFSKQRIGADSDIYFVGAQEAVLDVINMSGLDNFLIITNEM